jgi:excisionase family DNA binding protein
MATDNQHENTARPDLLTVTEVAQILRTSPSTVRYWRYTSYGPPGIKVGRRVLYRRADVEAFLSGPEVRRG